jgi:cytochrome c553
MRVGTTMFRHLFSAALGAAAIVAFANSAGAADDLDARLQTCNACHGANGRPISAEIPVIWGQQTAYMVKQIHDYRAKDRENPVMTPLAATVKQEETRKAATYFTAKTWPAGHAAAGAASEPKGMTVCKACHQPNFEGGLPAPRLAGQSYEYLLAAMKSFADETRTNSADMIRLMKMVRPEQRQEMARYLAGM